MIYIQKKKEEKIVFLTRYIFFLYKYEHILYLIMVSNNLDTNA